MTEPARTLAEALHRLRSTLARVQAEAELLELDGVRVDGMLEGLAEAFGYLGTAEEVGADASSGMVTELDGYPSVVLLEDDARLGLLLIQQLNGAGIPAVLALSVQAALQHAQSGALLVADLSVLLSANRDDLDTIRNARPILVTGAKGRAADEAAARFSVRSVLLKPVRLAELTRAIREAVTQEER